MYKTFVYLFFIAFFNVSASTAFASSSLCRIEGYAYQIECNHFTIATKNENHQHSIQYYKVASKVRYPYPEPIIWIPDGLGILTTERAPSMITLFSRARNYRDFIWLETRGTGEAGIGCRDQSQLDLADMLNRYQSNAWRKNCLAKLQAFNTAISIQKVAEDYEKLAVKLNLKQVVVFTEGKGIDVLNAWIKLAPTRFKSIVIDNPVTNEMDALQEKTIQLAERYQFIMKSCQKNQACSDKFEPGQHSISELMQRLPFNAILKNPLTGKSEKIIIDKTTFNLMLVSLIKQPSKSWLLPYAMQQASQNNWQPFISLTSIHAGRRATKFEHANNIVEQCLSFKVVKHIGFNSIEAQLMYQSEIERLTSLCTSFNLSSEVQGQFTRLDNHIPTLVFKSGLNPFSLNTPAEFKNSLQVTARGATGNLMSYGCAKDVMYRFLQNVEQQQALNKMMLEADCLTKIKAPEMPQYELIELTSL